MADLKEYRYHYIKIDKEELENIIINHMKKFTDKDDDSKEYIAFSDLLYATDSSLIGDSGDSYYNPKFKKHVKLLSENFSNIIFTAGWTNNENKKDKKEFTYQNGVLL